MPCSTCNTLSTLKHRYISAQDAHGQIDRPLPHVAKLYSTGSAIGCNYQHFPGKHRKAREKAWCIGTIWHNELQHFMTLLVREKCPWRRSKLKNDHSCGDASGYGSWATQPPCLEQHGTKRLSDVALHEAVHGFKASRHLRHQMVDPGRGRQVMPQEIS